MREVKGVISGDHLCYMLFSQSTNKTYIGYTNDIYQRLRKHRREIKGGAKYTRTGAPWDLALLVSGFPTKVSALQFEWAAKHINRRAHGRKMRTLNFFKLVCKERWTSKAPAAKDVSLRLHSFLCKPYITQDDIEKLPAYVSLQFYDE